MKREVERYLTCGDPRFGVVEVRCADCSASRVVAFCCKGRDGQVKQPGQIREGKRSTAVHDRHPPTERRDTPPSPARQHFDALEDVSVNRRDQPTIPFAFAVFGDEHVAHPQQPLPLDARYFASKLAPGKVASIVTVGRPHRGTPLADLGAKIPH